MWTRGALCARGRRSFRCASDDAAGRFFGVRSVSPREIFAAMKIESENLEIWCQREFSPRRRNFDAGRPRSTVDAVPSSLPSLRA
jgi:hypothetical protein